MMIGLATTFAFADGPPGLELARERTELLGGHVTLALARGMVLAPETDRAYLDSSTTRFTLDAVELHGVAGGELHQRVAAAIEVAGARIERLGVARPWAIYAVRPLFPPRIGDRVLVFAAYAASTTGTVEILTFYVNEAGFDDASAWAALARRIASTMVPVATRTPRRPPIDSQQAPETVPLPRGWRISGTGGMTSRLSSPRGARRYCEIRDGELDPHAVLDATTTQMLHGKLRGKDVYWSVWTDRAGSHAETMTGAATWGTLHVICHAARPTELDELRRVIEAHFAISRS